MKSLGIVRECGVECRLERFVFHTSLSVLGTAEYSLLPVPPPSASHPLVHSVGIDDHVLIIFAAHPIIVCRGLGRQAWITNGESLQDQDKSNRTWVEVIKTKH